MKITDSTVELTARRSYSKTQSYRGGKSFSFLGFGNALSGGGASGASGDSAEEKNKAQTNSFEKSSNEETSYLLYDAGGRWNLAEEEEKEGIDNLWTAKEDAAGSSATENDGVTGFDIDSALGVGSTSLTSQTFEEMWTQMRMNLIKAILEMLSTLYGDKASELAESLSAQMGLGSAGGSSTISPGTMLTKVTYTQEYSFVETESTTFNGQGIAYTEDGREIDFNVSFSMNRSFSSYLKMEQTGVVNMCDPLVINVGNGITEISDQKFSFDLDCDGMEDRISLLCKDSGYLALDKDGNGKIDDGSELFGTKTGDGFAELGTYDEDGNGWIDENDSVWKQLKVWMKNEDGTDNLLSIQNADVGAIYLGNTETEFAAYGDDDRIDGMVRKTGLFLYESGEAGIIQHIDLAAEAAQ